MEQSKAVKFKSSEIVKFKNSDGTLNGGSILDFKIQEGFQRKLLFRHSIIRMFLSMFISLFALSIRLSERLPPNLLSLYKVRLMPLTKVYYLILVIRSIKKSSNYGLTSITRRLRCLIL